MIKDEKNIEMNDGSKPTTVIDDIFKLQFSNDAEIEIYLDSAKEYAHTCQMSSSEKVVYEMSQLPILDDSVDGSVKSDI